MLKGLFSLQGRYRILHQTWFAFFLTFDEHGSGCFATKKVPQLAPIFVTFIIKEAVVEQLLKMTS